MLSSGQDIVFTVLDHSSGVPAVVQHKNEPINTQAGMEEEIKVSYLLLWKYLLLVAFWDC